MTRLTGSSVARVCAISAAIAMGCSGNDNNTTNSNNISDGPADQGPAFPHKTGDLNSGKTIFRLETFGNEGFWTDAMKLPQGVAAAGLTPVQALKLGLSVDVDALDTATKIAVAAEIVAHPNNDGPLLNDPATTVALINANAVMGVVAKGASGAGGKPDITKGDKVGVSCALCHSISDGSVLNVPNGGSIGKRVDGSTPHTLQVGKILAAAQNSAAFYPLLQLRLNANQLKSIGRAPDADAIPPLKANPTAQDLKDYEAKVDAYLSNPAYYPAGTFDDAPDGTGAPQHIVPFFRTDLGAPWGTPGDIAVLDNFNNLVYSVLLDPTILTTEGGKNFLRALGGKAAGEELAQNYIDILNATGVTGYPFVTSAAPSDPAQAGSEAFPAGRRVDSQKLLDLNAYTNSLHPLPNPNPPDATAVAAGRDVFRSNCTSCHNVAQNKPVPTIVVAQDKILANYTPTTLAQRPVELPFRPTAFAPIQDDPATIFDDKVVIVEASRRGEKRGSALPLLMELWRKPNFLHDSSIGSLDDLLDPSRSANGAKAPHPFFVQDATQRGNLVKFLQSLDDTK